MKTARKKIRQPHMRRYFLVRPHPMTRHRAFSLPFSTFVRHDSFLISRTQATTLSAAGNTSQFLAMQSQDFAIDHHIHWAVQIESMCCAAVPLRQRMLNVSAVVEARQIANQGPTGRSVPSERIRSSHR